MYFYSIGVLNSLKLKKNRVITTNSGPTVPMFTVCLVWFTTGTAAQRKTDRLSTVFLSFYEDDQQVSLGQQAHKVPVFGPLMLWKAKQRTPSVFYFGLCVSGHKSPIRYPKIPSQVWFSCPFLCLKNTQIVFENKERLKYTSTSNFYFVVGARGIRSYWPYVVARVLSHLTLNDKAAYLRCGKFQPSPLLDWVMIILMMDLIIYPNLLEIEPKRCTKYMTFCPDRFC